ncbi:MAG: DUF3035 domain-containing protein [Alphaproteobacteria bacterium]|nr:DUF3035 domain-containing protein [Alphaproteobacteria bacterium]
MNTKKSVIPAIIGLIVGAIGLSGCENAKEVIGLTKQAPDEFSIVTRAPLSIPPQYGLRPPKPGAARPQETTPTSKARTILLKNSGRKGQERAVASGKFSSGEAAFLKRAGALNPDPSIRQQVNVESSALADADKSVLRKVIFWQDPEVPGKIVDARKESRRLRQVTAQGDSVTKGETPVITRKKKGWLEGIF